MSDEEGDVAEQVQEEERDPVVDYDVFYEFGKSAFLGSLLLLIALTQLAIFASLEDPEIFNQISEILSHFALAYMFWPIIYWFLAAGGRFLGDWWRERRGVAS